MSIISKKSIYYEGVLLRKFFHLQIIADQNYIAIIILTETQTNPETDADVFNCLRPTIFRFIHSRLVTLVKLPVPRLVD